MRSIHNTTSFSGGEWSPKLDSRVDQQKYGSALRQCVNMIPYKSGGMTRRPGTQYIANAKYANSPGANYAVRLVSFIFDPDTCFVLEFGNYYVRFYSNGVQVTVSDAPVWQSGQAYVAGNFVEDPGVGNAIYYCKAAVTSATQPHSDPTNWVAQTIYEVPSPYGSFYSSGEPSQTEVFQIATCQVNDVIYITSPLRAPYSLTRFGDTDWVMEEVAFLSPALLDQNATDITITPSALQGTGITLTASAPAWVADNYYTLDNAVLVSGIIYNCILTNVSSSSFSTDLASGYWQSVGIFNPNHIGSTWQLAVLRSSAYVEYDGDKTTGFVAGTSSTIQCLGNYEIHTYGTWSADVSIQRSLDGGITWDSVYFATGRSDRNLDPKGNAPVLGIYRISVSNVAAPVNPGATNPRIVFECSNAFLYGQVEITAVTSIQPASFVNGATYQIEVLGTINWSAIGGRVNAAVGDILVYNGAGVTGSGGTANAPYIATADVITRLTDSNGLAAAWVSGGTYGTAVAGGSFVVGQTYQIVSIGSTNFTLIGASANTVGIVFTATGAGSGSGTAKSIVSYNFVNYTCILAISGGTTVPPQNPGNWSQTTPGATEYWSEAAWSNARGFPQAVTTFQQRIIYGSSASEPQRIWGSVTNDLENFALGDQTLATDGFAFDLNAVGRGPINWLIAQSDLFAGFSGAEWVINSGAGNSTGGAATITPTSINAVEQGTFGSAPFVQPKIVGNAVLFAQRQADAIRQMLFSIYTAKYMSQDLTTLADHLFTSGIVQLAYQSRWRHQGMLWAVTEQGTLCSLTYDLDQEVFGWCKANTGYLQLDSNGNPIISDNGFESVAVIDGQGKNDDEVWVVANRYIGGVQTRFIERINPNNWEETFIGAPTTPGPVLADAFYVDCGITITNPGSLTLTAFPTL